MMLMFSGQRLFIEAKRLNQSECTLVQKLVSVNIDALCCQVWKGCGQRNGQGQRTAIWSTVLRRLDVKVRKFSYLDRSLSSSFQFRALQEADISLGLPPLLTVLFTVFENTCTTQNAKLSVIFANISLSFILQRTVRRECRPLASRSVNFETLLNSLSRPS